mmetsp:Transcript_25601/g.33502  ORF Transcript_25601/g.33502 Transcript_25601/m.33502 type:complete len:354 (-) Transcript_25601:56-1117(-)
MAPSRFFAILLMFLSSIERRNCFLTTNSFSNYGSSSNIRNLILSNQASQFRMHLDDIDVISSEKIEKEITVTYPTVPTEFIDNVRKFGEAEMKNLPMNEKEQILQATKHIAKMDNLVLLSRGPDILSDNFVYYSPSTGLLNKDQYLAYIKVIDDAFPAARLSPRSFKVHGDGVVSYITDFQGVFDGSLQLDQIVIRGDGQEVVGNKELNVLAFDDDFHLQFLANGVVVGKMSPEMPLELVEEIEKVEAKLTSQKNKLGSLKGQEDSLSYKGIQEDILGLEKLVQNLKSQEPLQPNTGDFGGLHGLSHAVQATVPDNFARSLQRTVPDFVEGNKFDDIVGAPADCLDNEAKAGW